MPVVERVVDNTVRHHTTLEILALKAIHREGVPDLALIIVIGHKHKGLWRHLHLDRTGVGDALVLDILILEVNPDAIAWRYDEATQEESQYRDHSSAQHVRLEEPTKAHTTTQDSDDLTILC